MTPYVRYHDEIETVEPDEQDLIDRIISVFRRGNDLVRQNYGRSVRGTHAKAHGLLRGELHPLESLPEHLRQGLFAEARSFPVIVRLSHAPGEFLDDRRMSMPRGMSLKILDVDGPKLPLHDGERTQDFVLDTGKVFNNPGLETFLAQIAPIQTMAPRLPDAVKESLSAVAQVGTEVLERVRVTSAVMNFLGHPQRHPLAEPFYSQAAIRFGDYVAKLRVAPVTPELVALRDCPFEPADENGLRTATVDYFKTNGAEFEVAVQLCTDLKRMPIENSNTEWPEEVSSYQPVARLIVPAQYAFSAARQAFVEEHLSFCPAHSLAAHRPLGAIMRARMRTYEAMARVRRFQNGIPIDEPLSIDEMPD